MKPAAQLVSLGFEVGTGLPVNLPLRHMVVTGQTQEAGKTTALEALISRSGLRALTFITKRGEGSFTGSRRVDPYFREQADWEFVRSILEASRGEKLKFERAWIIRASKGARTLADVQRNVRKAMEKAHGLSADVYLTLDAYLDAIVPTIARVRWAPRLELAAGVNAVDLTSVPTEMQHLVIKSSIEWVLEHEEHTVVVIPEAWKFMPQGRNTPVKLAAQAYIRQGAGLQNYLWLDSQDIGGVDKETLRSVPVWLLGVQRETNEIKRTLDNIPASVKKPTKAAIAQLELGQFYACWGAHTIKTYVQPAWMPGASAMDVALGRVSLESLRETVDAVSKIFDRERQQEEHTVTDDEARALREENDTLKRTNADLQRRLDALEKGLHEKADSGSPQSHRGVARQDVARHANDLVPDGRAAVRPAPSGETPRRDRAFTAEESFDNEALYQAIKARLIAELPEDSRVIEIVLQRPELRVKVERKIITADGDSLQGRLGLLLSKGFFDEAQTNSTTLSELARTGFSTAAPNVSRELADLTRMGFLTRDNKWYRSVPEMKANIREAELV